MPKDTRPARDVLKFQMTENQKLSILQLAQLWAAEYPASGYKTDDIARDLVEAASRGEFDTESSRDESEEGSTLENPTNIAAEHTDLVTETGEPTSSEEISRRLAGGSGGLLSKLAGYKGRGAPRSSRYASDTRRPRSLVQPGRV